MIAYARHIPFRAKLVIPNACAGWNMLTTTQIKAPTYIYIYIYICAQSQSYIVRIYYYMETKSLFFFPKKKRVCTEDRPLKRTSRKLFPRKENKDRWWALPARSAHDGAQLEENIWRCSISYILLKQCLHAWHHHPSSCSLICSLVGSMHA
jgi:hypothetical protein